MLHDFAPSSGIDFRGSEPTNRCTQPATLRQWTDAYRRRPPGRSVSYWVTVSVIMMDCELLPDPVAMTEIVDVPGGVFS
jgi:hypothetical protein